MARILITGAAGFLGTRLVQLLQPHHELVALGRRVPEGAPWNNMEWVLQDLSEALDYSRLPDRVDAIISLAQSQHYREFPHQAEDIFAVNIRSTFELLEYARKSGTHYFMFASSGGIYGYSYEKFVETDPVNPLNFYLSSKYTAELLIANYQRFFRTVVFRFFFVFGPGQKGMLIPNLLHKVMHGDLITIDGNPGLRINPVYLEDAVRVFEPALHLQTSTLFNVAGDETVTIRDLVTILEKVTGKRALVQHREVNPGGDLIGDNARMREVLSISPRISLLEGLRNMVEASWKMDETR
jgi:UDP-glucose 4-epimerase